MIVQPPPPVLPSPLPAVEEILARTHVVALPMRVRFRGVTVREAALIEGPAGWGEFAPFLEYPPAEAAAWLAAGLETAWLGLPAPASGSVEVNATVPAMDPADVPELLERYPGCTTVKVKVAERGQTLDDDRARVAAVRAARPGAVVRVDANRGWSVSEAVRAAEVLGELAYLEQPCASVAELRQLRAELDRRGITTPIAADESIRRAADPYLVAGSGACGWAVLKVAPLGGVRRLAAIAEHLRGAGMHVTVASALDTAVGMNAGLVAASLLSEAPAGLATQSLFAADVAAPRELVGGRRPPGPAGPEPEGGAERAAAPERRDWWFGRIRAAHACLAEAHRETGAGE